MRKSVFAAGIFSLALVASACSSTDDSRPAASSAHHPSAVSSVAASPDNDETPTSPQAQHPARPAPQPEQDDDPGGHPCTNQDGAPGHLIPTEDGHWVCNITGDAPQADRDRHADHDDDPGGHPCTNQDGAPGHLIPTEDGHWVCNITGDAPRN